MLCIKINYTLIYWFVYFWHGVLQLLKLLIQGLRWFYNKYIFFDLIKTKALLMASTNRVVLNIDGLIIHSTLNIHVQQFLFNLPNLSTNSLYKFTCQYKQLQLVVIDEISFVGARMLNVINIKLRSIKHIQNKFFSGVDVFMKIDFY